MCVCVCLVALVQVKEWDVDASVAHHQAAPHGDRLQDVRARSLERVDDGGANGVQLLRRLDLERQPVGGVREV